jgi:hypothetical protein
MAEDVRSDISRIRTVEGLTKNCLIRPLLEYGVLKAKQNQTQNVYSPLPEVLFPELRSQLKSILSKLVVPGVSWP